MFQEVIKSVMSESSMNLLLVLDASISSPPKPPACSCFAEEPKAPLLNPLSPGGTYMVHKKLLFLSTPRLQG